VRELADAVVEPALAPAYAAEVEAQRGKAAMHEGVVELINDLMVHRAAELRVRMQHNANRGVFLTRRVIAALDATGGAGEDDFGHGCGTSIYPAGSVVARALDGTGRRT